MEEFPSNSKNPTGPGGKPLPPDKKIEKITTGVVIKRQQSIGVKFKKIFFGGDFKSVIKFVAAGVLLPSLRDMFVNAVNRGTERMVYGETGKRPISNQQQIGPRVNYNNPYTSIGRDPRDTQRSLPPTYVRQTPQSSIGSRRDDFVVFLASREDAENVLDRMYEIISKYNVVSIRDLNELIGLEGSYVDSDWGWTYLQNVAIRQTKEGYVIDLPQAEPI